MSVLFGNNCGVKCSAAHCLREAFVLSLETEVVESRENRADSLKFGIAWSAIRY
jgi:hypothetical protein